MAKRPLMTFGKYKGEPRDWVLDDDPDYAIWAHENVKWFKLTKEELEFCYESSRWLRRRGVTGPKYFNDVHWGDDQLEDYWDFEHATT